MDAFVWPAEFNCTIIDENLILPNHYRISLFVEPIYPVNDNIGIGFKKIKHIIDYRFSNSVVVNQSHRLLPSLKEMDINIVHFPIEPYDYYFGAILLAKLKAVTEKYFHLYQLSIDSQIGERIQYTLSDPSECNIDLSGNHWWNMDDNGTGTDPVQTWEELNLKNTVGFEPKIIQGGLSENR